MKKKLLFGVGAICAFLLSFLGFNSCRNHENVETMYGGPSMFEKERKDMADSVKDTREEMPVTVIDEQEEKK